MGILYRFLIVSGPAAAAALDPAARQRLLALSPLVPALLWLGWLVPDPRRHFPVLVSAAALQRVAAQGWLSIR